MSWAAMNYVFRLAKDREIAGNVRFVLLCIAKFIPKRQGCMETGPTPQGVLCQMTGLDAKTVRDCIRRLIAKGELQIGQPGRGRGQHQTFIMLNLAGPLFSVSEKQGASPAISEPVKEGASPCLGVEKGESSRRSVRTSSSSKNVRTKRETATTQGKHTAAAIYDATLAFLNWYQATFPTHHFGASIAVDYEADGPRVERLLTDRSGCDLARLQAMTLAMWTATPAEDKFIAGAQDRGLTLLVYAADRLDRISRAREAQPAPAALGYDATARCPHTPKCLSPWDCSAYNRNKSEAVG